MCAHRRELDKVDKLLAMPNLIIRNFQPNDLSSLTQLINEADRVDDAGFATTPAAFAERLAEPGVEPAENLFVAEVSGRLVGYALLRKRREETVHCISVTGIVHPQWRRQGIGTALMQRAEERAASLRQDKPLFLEAYARERVAGADELALAIGMRPVRYFFYMQCHDLDSLPEPAFPSSITVRNLTPALDAERFLTAYNDAFSDHWGYVPATRKQLQHWFNSSGFCVENTLLAVTDQGDIAGLCIVLFPQMEPEMLKTNPPLIDDLAVPHAYRRQGIGRALLLAGMHRIRKQGFHAAALAVDADNPNHALRLYESVGFAIESRTTAYRKELA
jgi:mycothiol synthase